MPGSSAVVWAHGCKLMWPCFVACRSAGRHRTAACVGSARSRAAVARPLVVAACCDRMARRLLSPTMPPTLRPSQGAGSAMAWPSRVCCQRASRATSLSVSGRCARRHVARACARDTSSVCVLGEARPRLESVTGWGTASLALRVRGLRSQRLVSIEVATSVRLMSPTQATSRLCASTAGVWRARGVPAARHAV